MIPNSDVLPAMRQVALPVNSELIWMKIKKFGVAVVVASNVRTKTLARSVSMVIT